MHLTEYKKWLTLTQKIVRLKSNKINYEESFSLEVHFINQNKSKLCI